MKEEWELGNEIRWWWRHDRVDSQNKGLEVKNQTQLFGVTK